MAYGMDFGGALLPGFGRFQRPMARRAAGAHLRHDIENIARRGIEPGSGALETGLVKFDLARAAVQPDARDVIVRIGGLS